MVTIAMTDRFTNVSGTVQDSQRPVADYVVVILPRKAIEGMGASRYIRVLRPDRDGAFTVRGLPPGDYAAAAFESLESGREWDPEAQKVIRSSGRDFTLSEGQDAVTEPGVVAMRRIAAATLCAMMLTTSVGAQSAGTASQPTRVPPRDPTATTAPATGTGRLRGRVLQAGSSTPIRLAQVTLSGDQNVRRMVTTDGEGRYEFTDLPAGVFTVSVAKPGFLTLQYGQRRPFETGRPVTLAAAQALGQIDLALPRASVITGRVTDRLGEPAIDAEILIERYQYSSDGQRRLNRLAATATNDLGEFRAFGLMPGEYIVSAKLRGRPSLAAAIGQQGPAAPLAGYLQTYSPGTPNVVDAEPVLLGLGEEANVQIALSTGRMSTISGTILDSQGRPAAGANLMLVITAGSSRSGQSSGSAAADGAFFIPNVPPGDHFIQVRLPPRPERPGLAGERQCSCGRRGRERVGPSDRDGVPGHVVRRGCSGRAQRHAPPASPRPRCG